MGTSGFQNNSLVLYDGCTGDRDDSVVLVIDVDLIAIEDCCVAYIICKFGCAQEGRFGDAGGDVDILCRCSHISGKLANLSGFLCGPIEQSEDFV